MYQRMLVALDGSKDSNLARDAAITLAEGTNSAQLIGCHVYAARLHRVRFEEMEPGLPERYLEEERLKYLRGTHEGLISDGMQLISDAYLAPLLQKAHERKLAFEGLTPEGRNYIELLRIVKEKKVDLAIMGAQGHGHVPEGRLGSLTERMLLYAAKTDILMMHRPWNFKNHPVVVGIDGSENSYWALKRAVEIAQTFEARVEAVAVYDPFFHIDVFQTIAKTLPAEAKARFDFPAQEKLHDEIIDRGLEQLYREGLERGVLLARAMGIEVHPEVVMGKVYPQLHHYAALRGAGLVVIGRWGLHREQDSLIGSNTLNLARISTTNVLVVAPSQELLEVPQLIRSEEAPLPWTSEAEAILERIPPFARQMAQRAIETRAREKGCSKVTHQLVQEIAQSLGMGGTSNPSTNSK